jgi:tRNA (guanine-N7-)-methyltransferase
VSRRLKYDIPGRDFRVYEDEIGVPPRLARWEEIFAPDVSPPLRITLDIGFGRGEFLLELARREPDRAFVGIERSFKRTLKMARRLARQGVGNVRLVEALGESALPDLFPAGSVECAWINFPDPWPKDRHARRRLVQPAFVRELALRLAPGGELHCATDDPAYAEQMAAVLAAEPRLENRFAPDAFRREVPGRPPTGYELEWRAQGRSCHFFDYCRRADRGEGDADDAPPPA